MFDRKRYQFGEHCCHWIRGQRSLKHSRVRRTAFEVLLLGVFPARGFDGHHTLRTSGGMFRMQIIAARARTVRSVFTRARCDRSTMSRRFDLLARDFESCQTQDACAAQLSHGRFAATQQQSRLIMSCVCRCSPSNVLAHVSHSVRAAISSLYWAALSSFCWSVEHFTRKCQSKCRRSVVKSEHHGRLSVAPVAKHNPCPFDGTHGMQTRQTCLCCCFFRQVVRRHLPMRAYLVQFQFRSSSMNPFFFTSNETCRCVPDGIRCVTLPLPALPRGTGVQRVSQWVTSTLLNVRISCRFRCTW